MECRVKWLGPEGMSFVAETESGHAFVMDGAPEGGGRDLGPRPMETVLAGTGGCTAYDVVVILRKSGQQISACEVRLIAERAQADPKRTTDGFGEAQGADAHFVVDQEQVIDLPKRSR